MFENADKCVKTHKTEEQHVEVVYKTIEYHLAMLAKNFKKYFFAEDNLIASYEWAEVDDEFSELKTKAFRILLPFSTSYLCETGFSAVVDLKTKYRSQLNIEK
ncbi:zinc finger BED domain-containing protein 5 [Trichonephila clavipes]|nr:zinc finger BED domain-containing protein 5 [Trichonephila clavipes]